MSEKNNPQNPQETAPYAAQGPAEQPTQQTAAEQPAAQQPAADQPAPAAPAAPVAPAAPAAPRKRRTFGLPLLAAISAVALVLGGLIGGIIGYAVHDDGPDFGRGPGMMQERGEGGELPQPPGGFGRGGHGPHNHGDWMDELPGDGSDDAPDADDPAESPSQTPGLDG